jgi:putative hemolysin
MLLWSGIARFVALRPEYRYLFGAVSVSAAYSAGARHLITQYLKRHAWRSDLAAVVDPRHPFDSAGAPVHDGPVPESLSALDRAVSEADAEGKGLPVLLRQYLKLNARAFGFSIDPAFSGVLDVLVVVDLLAMPSAVLGRYMGAEAASAFLLVHQAERSEAVADGVALIA